MKRTGMINIKDILRHRHGLGLPRAQIAATTGVSEGTVSHVLDRASAAGLSWPLDEAVDGSHRGSFVGEHLVPLMGEARPGETEVIEHVIQRLPGDSHAKRPHAGEVRQALPARLMLLAEDHLPLGAVLGAPDADPPLQGLPHTLAQLGMAAQQLLEHADRADAGTVLENRHDVRLEDIGQRVRPLPATRLALPGRQRRIGGQPVAGGPAEARLGGRNLDGVGLLYPRTGPSGTTPRPC